jgi:hypothetical protein
MSWLKSVSDLKVSGPGWEDLPPMNKGIVKCRSLSGLGNARGLETIFRLNGTYTVGLHPQSVLIF